jgi:hypothetical protein
MDRVRRRESANRTMSDSCARTIWDDELEGEYKEEACRVSREKLGRGNERRATGAEVGKEATGRGTPPCFSDVWQAKDFKSNEFGSVANAGVTGEILGCVAGKGVRWEVACCE